MTDLFRIEDLIERLDKAEGPDHALDYMTHEATMPSLRMGLRYGKIPEYTASLDAAVAFCERLLPGYNRIHEQYKDAFNVRLGIRKTTTGVDVWHTSEAIAVVLAVLRAYRASLQSKEVA